MILVVSPNLAVDYTLHLERLTTGRVHRSTSSERQAGGKGVNTSRALRGLGEQVLLCGFVGGQAGRSIEMGLAKEGLSSDLVSFEGESRTCVILLSADGQATVVNEPGPRIDGKRPLLERFESRLDRCKAVALMGSLPPGLPHDTFAEMVSLSRKADVPCLVDTSGVPLQAALAARPTYAKPNLTEAEELLDEKLLSEKEWLGAAEKIESAGAEVAIITLGAQGAVVVGSGVRARVTPPEVARGNATGAGDAMAAGLLTGRVRGENLRQVVTLGMAAAAASERHGYG